MFLRATAALLSTLLAVQSGTLAFAQQAGEDTQWETMASRLAERHASTTQAIKKFLSTSDQPKSKSQVFNELSAIGKNFKETHSLLAEVDQMQEEAGEKLKNAPPAMTTALANIREALPLAQADLEESTEHLQKLQDELSHSQQQSAQDSGQGSKEEDRAELRRQTEAYFKKTKKPSQDLLHKLTALSQNFERMHQEAQNVKKQFSNRIRQAQSMTAQVPPAMQADYQRNLDRAAELSRSGDTRGAEALLSKTMDGAQGHANRDINDQGQVIQTNDPTSSDPFSKPKPRLDNINVPPPARAPSKATKENEDNTFTARVGEKWDAWTNRRQGWIDAAPKTISGDDAPKELVVDGTKWGVKVGGAVGAAGVGAGSAVVCSPGGLIASAACGGAGAIGGFEIGGVAGAYVGGTIGLGLDYIKNGTHYLIYGN